MYSEKVREIAISLYKQIKSYRKVASMLNISKSIIHYWVNYKYTPKEKTLPLNKIIRYIRNLLNKNCFITIKEITISTNNYFNTKLSTSFIYTTIKQKLKYSFKKITKKNFSSNINKLVKRKKLFKKKYKKFQNIICLDETYIHTNIHYNYGWAKSGERLEKYIRVNPIKYSIIVAISTDGVFHYKISKNNINKDVFKNFIIELNSKVKNKLYLMDNVRFHKSKEVMDIINSSTNNAIFIPPYSPELNPIEEVFSLFKNNVRKNNGSNVVKKITAELDKLKNKNFENYYKHSFQD